MIICICRNIKDSDYSTNEELIQRVMEQDACCGQCQEYCSQLVKHTIDLEVA